MLHFVFEAAIYKHMYMTHSLSNTSFMTIHVLSRHFSLHLGTLVFEITTFLTSVFAAECCGFQHFTYLRNTGQLTGALPRLYDSVTSLT